jgi:hypothetical protein
MDDIGIGTNNTPERHALHKKIVHEFLHLLEQHSYYLKVSKCEFEWSIIEFLGFKVSEGTIKVDDSKCRGIANWPRELKSVKEVQQILGVLGYQRAFIQNYALITRPLHQLLRKDVPFEWIPRC